LSEIRWDLLISVESRAKADTGNINNSLKGVIPSLFRGFMVLPVPSLLRLFRSNKTSDKERSASSLHSHAERGNEMK